MIELHHCISARSFRPLWMLEELGLRYQLKIWPFPPREHARDFLALNPLGTVPLFIDGDVRMTESAAICQYLAAQSRPTPLDVDTDEAAFAAYLNWLSFGESTLTFPQTLVLRYGRFEAAERRNPQVVEDYTRWFLARLRAVEAALAKGDFLCGGRFTAADVSVGYALMLGEHLALHAQFPPKVLSYWGRLQERPAYRRAMAAQHAAAKAQGVSSTPAPDTGGD
jgi:glutathione S-transferase